MTRPTPSQIAKLLNRPVGAVLAVPADEYHRHATAVRTMYARIDLSCRGLTYCSALYRAYATFQRGRKRVRLPGGEDALRQVCGLVARRMNEAGCDGVIMIALAQDAFTQFRRAQKTVKGVLSNLVGMIEEHLRDLRMFMAHFNQDFKVVTDRPGWCWSEQTLRLKDLDPEDPLFRELLMRTIRATRAVAAHVAESRYSRLFASWFKPRPPLEYVVSGATVLPSPSPMLQCVTHKGQQAGQSTDAGKRLQVDLRGLTATLDGRTFKLTRRRAEVLTTLVEHAGEWLSRTSLARVPTGCERPDQHVNNLPDEIRELIESGPYGYKLPLDHKKARAAHV